MKRHELIVFRVSPDERLVINSMAIDDGRNTSEFLRELVRSELQRRGVGIQEAIKNKVSGNERNRSNP
jgi:hypothetical protein